MRLGPYYFSSVHITHVLCILSFYQHVVGVMMQCIGDVDQLVC